MLEQTYARADEEFREKIKEEKFDLLTVDDEVILPAVWDYIIKNHLPLQGSRGMYWYTVRISFWPSSSPPPPQEQSSDPKGAEGANSAKANQDVNPDEVIIRRGSKEIRIGKYDPPRLGASR